MTAPCANFWTIPQIRCAVGSMSQQGSGLHAPRDCHTCLVNGIRYRAQYEHETNYDDIEDVERAAAWRNAITQ